MNFYLIDDDKNVHNILKIIIRSRGLGEICGTSLNAAEALEDLAHVYADIVIVDLLMPEMDGITFVKQAKERYGHLAFIMLSQVSSKDMVSSAYEAGVEFFIQKPLNSIEIESVVNKVIQQVSMKRTLHKMQSLFLEEVSPAVSAAPPVPAKEYVSVLKTILQKLGIIGELGSKDIIALVEYLIHHAEQLEHHTLTELCSYISDSPKSAEQRIRRAANAGLVNLAHLGLEDYSNDIFVEFSNTLYNFEQVRKEMDYIRGKGGRHGNVKIKSFLHSLLSYVNQ